MTFLAPWLLSLAAFAGVPLLLHLLRQRVTRRVEFPAVRFLVDAERAHRRDRALRHRALLLLRMLAVLLIAIAAARPVTTRLAALVGAGHSPIALAIVVDQSASAGVVANDSTLWQRHRTVVGTLLAQLDSEDRAWIVTTTGVVLSGTAATLQTQLDSLVPVHTAGDMAGALRRAYRLLEGEQRAERGNAPVTRAPVAVVMTDGQLHATDSVALHRLLSQGAGATDNDQVAALPPTLVHVTPVTAPPNRSVLALEVTSATWLPGSSLTATVTRTAAGTSGTPSAWRLEQGERTISRGTLDTVTTRAGSTGAQDTVQLQWTPSTLAMADTGWISLRLVLDPDAFGTDNARVAVVRRAPPLSVNAREGAGFFVRTALETMADEGRLTLSTMGSARIEVLDASELETLGATVNDNRALLLVAPRDPLRATVANRALARRRIPWRFGSVLRDTTALVVTRPLADSMTSGAERSARHLEGMTVTQRYQLTSTTDGAPSRVHAGAGGVPWMVSGVIPSATGDARYVLVGSALTPEATRLPISAAFVPWMTALMFDALGNERAADSLTAGNVPSAESDFTHLGATTAWRAVTRSATGGAVTLVDDARILVRDTFRQPGKRSLVWPLLLAALLLLVTEGFLVRQLTDRRI